MENEQHLIRNPHELLDENGMLVESGYSTDFILDYNREKIKRKTKIKEWDHYIIASARYMIDFVISDNSSMACCEVSFMSFEDMRDGFNKIAARPFSFGRLDMPRTPENGTTVYLGHDRLVKFYHDGNSRRIECDIKKYYKGKDLHAEFMLTEASKDDIVYCAPFAKPGFFSYKQRTTGLNVEGTVSIGNDTYWFPKEESYAVLNWYRGVRPHKDEMIWGCVDGYIGKDHVVLCMGRDGSDDSAASENAIFINGTLHKLSQINFTIQSDGKHYEYMKTWAVTSDDGSVELDFVPKHCCYSRLGRFFKSSDVVRTFGVFSGELQLENGEFIAVENMLGCAYHTVSRW